MSTLHERLLAAIAGIADGAEWGDACGPLVDALRTVVELHAPQDTYPGSTTRIGWTACVGCDCTGYEWEYPDYPCSTIQAIARELGLPQEPPREENRRG